MANELEIPGGIRTTKNVEADAWCGPYASLAAARAAVPTAMRLYRTVKVIEAGEVVEYIWRAGTGDGDLVIKSSVVDQATEADYGTTVYGTQVEVEDAADNPTLSAIPVNETVHLRGLRWFINRVFATARTIGGIWSAPTPTLGTDSTQIATTQFVQAALGKGVVDLGDVSGVVTLNLANGRKFKCRATGNITAFSFSNEVEGLDYTLDITTETTAKSITFVASKFRFPFNLAPQLTSPLANGSAPAKAVDKFVFTCAVAGRLDCVITPDLRDN